MGKSNSSEDTSNLSIVIEFDTPVSGTVKPLESAVSPEQSPAPEPTLELELETAPTKTRPRSSEAPKDSKTAPLRKPRRLSNLIPYAALGASLCYGYLILSGADSSTHVMAPVQASSESLPVASRDLANLPQSIPMPVAPIVLDSERPPPKTKILQPKKPAPVSHAFFAALHAGNEAVLTKILRNGKLQVNTARHRGLTPLTMAAHEGSAKMVRFLLQKGKANPNIKDAYGNTALIYATRKNRVAIAQLLTKAGANPALRNSSGESPLSIALHHHNKALLSLFRKKKAKPAKVQIAKTNRATAAVSVAPEQTAPAMSNPAAKTPVITNPVANSPVNLIPVTSDGSLKNGRSRPGGPGTDLDFQGY